MNDQERTTSLCMQIAGGISCGASILVVVTIATVEALKKKAYNKYVLYVASANLIGSFGASLGFVKEGTFWCWFQGLVTNYFPLLSLFWTTYLGYMLFKLLFRFTRNKLQPSSSTEPVPFLLQAFIWLFPAFLTLIPLTTNTYGVYGDDTEYGWCFIEKSSRSTSWSTSFWIIAAFYFWIWAALGVYFILFGYVYYVVTREYTGHVIVVMKSAVHNLGLYLLVIIVCWGFATIYDTLDSLDSMHGFLGNAFASGVSFVMPIFQGTLTACVFFYTNNEATAYLKYYATCCTSEKPVISMKRSNASSNSSMAPRGVSTEGTSLTPTSVGTYTSSEFDNLQWVSSQISAPLLHLETVRETSERDSSSSGVRMSSMFDGIGCKESVGGDV